MSLMNELKAEITRLARREIKKELESIKRVNATQRGLIASLRRDVTELQKENARLRKDVPKAPPAEDDTEETGRFWISGRGVKSLRKRLGVTLAEFGLLANVSMQTVMKWEKTEGTIKLRRQETAGLLKMMRGTGKQEVRERLGRLRD